MHILIPAFAAVIAASASAQQPVDASGTPPGTEKTAKTRALEAGARLLQSHRPMSGFDVYLVGFHPMKENPLQQMESHHYCHQRNEDFAQCVLFDGNSKDANLHGIEYIISEKLFATLPAKEQAYWHPHNGEILSGQLMAPGIPAAAEKSLLKSKMNSYGKTWHVWKTGHRGQRNDPLPFGPPMLAWSFNRDGEAESGLVEARDRRMDLSTANARRAREELRALARPQSGVDDLKGQFGRPTRDIPGVQQRDR